MNIIENFTTVNYEPMSNKVNKFIVVHYTGNVTDTAKANANYFKSVNRGASAHYFVDDNDIYQVVRDKDAAWAVGKLYNKSVAKLWGICTNYNSISVELCSVGGEITEQTQNNAAELIKSLMRKYNIPIDNVVRHYDVCGKQCPGWSGWYGSDSSKWVAFLKKVGGSQPQPTPTPTPTTHYDAYYSVKAGKIYPEVKNTDDYAGVRGRAITDMAARISSGSLEYRVHVLGGNWLPWVSGCDWNDYQNGYAGNGKAIDCIQMRTGSDVNANIMYRVSPIGQDYLPWVTEINDYAGIYGRKIDRIQVKFDR